LPDQKGCTFEQDAGCPYLAQNASDEAKSFLFHQIINGILRGSRLEALDKEPRRPLGKFRAPKPSEEWSGQTTSGEICSKVFPIEISPTEDPLRLWCPRILGLPPSPKELPADYDVIGVLLAVTLSLSENIALLFSSSKLAPPKYTKPEAATTCGARKNFALGLIGQKIEKSRVAHHHDAPREMGRVQHS